MAIPERIFDQISDRVPLSQKVVAQITEALSKGQLQPGDRLPTERDMAVQFGVSRMAVRDATKLLAGRGILEVKRGAGIFVASRELVARHFADLLHIRHGSISELFEIRKVIEVQAAVWAAERGRPEHVEGIRSVVRRARDAQSDPAVLFMLDAEFHIAVAEAARNRVLLRIMRNLLDLLASSREESLRIAGRATQSIDEHERVADAIQQHDAAAARREMWYHLNSVEESLIQHLDALGRSWRRETVSEGDHWSQAS